MIVSLLGRRARSALAVLVLAGASVLAAGTAEAQFFAYGFRYGPAPIHLPGPYYRGPRVSIDDDEIDIVGDLRERGFSRIAIVQRRGDVYVVDALDRRRQEIRLIVDAYDGEILQRFPYARDPARKVAALRDPAAKKSEPPKADPAKKEAPRRDLTIRDPLPREPARPAVPPVVQPATPPVAAAPVPPRRPASIVPRFAPAAGSQQALPARRPSDWAPINSVPVAPLD